MRKKSFATNDLFPYANSAECVLLQNVCPAKGDMPGFKIFLQKGGH